VTETETSERFLPDLRTGEQLPATPENAAAIIVAVKSTRRLLTQAVEMATEILVEEARRQGTRTLHVGGEKIELGPDYEIEWDVTKLAELKDAGLSEDRYRELVVEVVSFKVNAAVAKQVAGVDPEYARIVEEARRRVPKRVYASVKS
jgi:hypothetical protein